MATAKKLPSGNWRVRVYDKDSKTYQSFTAPSKKEAEYAAQEYLNGKKPLTEKTIGESIDMYIKLKQRQLSPITVEKYENIKKNQLSDIFLNIRLKKITSVDIQEEINRLSEKNMLQKLLRTLTA